MAILTLIMSQFTSDLELVSFSNLEATSSGHSGLSKASQKHGDKITVHSKQQNTHLIVLLAH